MVVFTTKARIIHTTSQKESEAFCLVDKTCHAYQPT